MIPKTGETVFYAYPDHGYPLDQERAAAVLAPRTPYTVRRVDVHFSSSHVYLDGMDEPFNSTLFSHSPDGDFDKDFS